MTKILISGGSGMIGTAVSEALHRRGYRIAWLSHSGKSHPLFEVYKWNVENGEYDTRAFKDVEHVIHLAGAGIADKRWRAPYKKEILESRVRSTLLLVDAVNKYGAKVRSVTGASAVGFYGSHLNSPLFSEADPPANDFMARVCSQWENSYQGLNPSCRLVILRQGVVLSMNGGAMRKMLLSYKFRLCPIPGSGQQHLSWIHVDDLVRLYGETVVNSQYSGTYNAVADEPVSFERFCAEIAAVLKKKVIKFNLPGWLLQAGIGGLADTLVKGTRVNNAKLHAAGFKLEYPTIHHALTTLLVRSSDTP
jgi:uncharacterized protein